MRIPKKDVEARVNLINSNLDTCHISLGGHNGASTIELYDGKDGYDYLKELHYGTLYECYVYLKGLMERPGLK